MSITFDKALFILIVFGLLVSIYLHERSFRRLASLAVSRKKLPEWIVHYRIDNEVGQLKISAWTYQQAVEKAREFTYSKRKTSAHPVWALERIR